MESLWKTRNVCAIRGGGSRLHLYVLNVLVHTLMYKKFKGRNMIVGRGERKGGGDH